MVGVGAVATGSVQGRGLCGADNTQFPDLGAGPTGMF